MEELTPQENNRVPLWKQLLGAVVGGGLALAIYYTYDTVKPQVTAWIMLPAAEGGRTFDLGAASIADKDLDDNQRKRFVSKNLQVAQQLENADYGENAMAAADDHSLDIDWPGHEVQTVPEVMMEDQVFPMDDAMPMEQQYMYEEQMATQEMNVGNSNNYLWGDVPGGDTMQDNEVSNAPVLPDSGFGIGFLVAGAAGGAASIRRRKKKA